MILTTNELNRVLSKYIDDFGTGKRFTLAAIEDENHDRDLILSNERLKDTFENTYPYVFDISIDNQTIYFLNRNYKYLAPDRSFHFDEIGYSCDVSSKEFSYLCGQKKNINDNTPLIRMYLYDYKTNPLYKITSAMHYRMTLMRLYDDLVNKIYFK